jgi:hypothetical protein
VENTTASLSGTAVEGVADGNDGWGVHGINNSGIGVGGESAYMTGVEGLSTNRIGVYGRGGTRGVYGASSTGTGVYGSGDTGVGVAGVGATYGVSGTATSGIAGVYGSGNGRGVEGYATSSSGVGVYGHSDVGGMGVSGNTNAGLASGVAATVGYNWGGGYGVWAYGGVGLKAQTVSGQIIEGYSGAGAGTKVFRLDSTGRGFFNNGYQTGGVDLAEFIQVSDGAQPGDVVEIDPDHAGQFRLAATPNSTAVAGVLSTAPGGSLGAIDPAGAENSGPQLALVGRVPVKVSAENEAIHPGDLLVASSTPGHAMRAPAEPAPGTVIGKALGDLDSGTGVIEMLVMLR